MYRLVPSSQMMSAAWGLEPRLTQAVPRTMTGRSEASGGAATVVTIESKNSEFKKKNPENRLSLLPHFSVKKQIRARIEFLVQNLDYFSPSPNGLSTHASSYLSSSQQIEHASYFCL
jgi:hypothetical protein